MRNAIAVMNTKGGVGKSTFVLAAAETLAAKLAKTVLVIDGDAQASVSLMLLSAGNLSRLQLDGLTVVDLLVGGVLRDEAVDWSRYVVAGVSDVDEARSVYLLPSDMQLTLFEREVAKQGLLAPLRAGIGALLGHVRAAFDVVLIDCAPGLSVLTECWLREADYYLAPTNPDHISTYALEVFAHFRGLNPEMGFADQLGVLITMMDDQSPADREHARRLMEDAQNKCFAQALPRSKALQHAGHFSTVERSYGRKYPGPTGAAVEAVCREMLERLAAAPAASATASPPVAPA